MRKKKEVKKFDYGKPLQGGDKKRKKNQYIPPSITNMESCGLFRW